MKSIKFFLLAGLLCFLTVSLTAQTLTSGSIKMEITEVNSDNEQMAAGLEMMKGMITEYSFNKEYSMSTSDIMGGMVKTKSLIKNESEDMTMLMDMMGNKMHVESTKAERDKAMAGNDMMDDIDVSYDDTDKKTILGYDCIKATVTGIGGEEMSMKFNMYVAKDLKMSNKLIQGMDAIDLDGFPLEYTLENEQMTMTYAATEINKEISADAFDLKTAGYTKMTWEEFTESMQAMGGGMGF